MTTRKQFKITYSTLGSPDPELHAYFDEALDHVRGQMGQTHKMYINGAWVEAAATFAKYSPVDTSLHMGTFQEGDAAAVAAAVAAAKAAYPAWRATPWQDRVALLRTVAARISERLFTMAAVDTLEVGKNRLEALGDIEEAAEFIRAYCDAMERNDGFVLAQQAESERHSNRSVLKPYGVWAVIAPFNFPMALAGGPTGAALVTGNTVVLKPAEDAPWTPTLLAQVIAEVFAEAGVPAGVFNMVTGGKETGRALVEHADVAGITFTGSYKVGMEIYREAATGPHARPVLAEMGGKNAAIVTRNADLDKAVQGVVRSAFGLQGQKCSACSRVFVDESLHATFVDRLVAATEAVRVGDPTRADVWMGPLSTQRAYSNYQAAVQDLAAHGDLRTGGALLENTGYYVAPTVVDNLPADHAIWRQELFLPIVCVAPVANLDEALARANDVPFGLTAGIYSEDDAEVEQFFETIEAGVVYANRESGATTGAWPGYQPFGGWKGSSTTGRGSGGAHYLQQYMREQSQTVVR